MAPYTFYDASIVATTSALKSTKAILELAEKNPSTDPTTLCKARLYEDMRNLASQAHLIAQAVERMLARIEGCEPTPMEDDIATFADMYKRLDTSIEAVEKLEREKVNERGEVVEETELLPGWKTQMKVADFVGSASVPNIFFHLNMVYAILRKEGVPLSKKDYIMSFMAPVLGQ